MAEIKKIILIKAGGNSFLQIPLGNKTLLKTPYSYFFPSIIPLIELVFQNDFSENQGKRMDFYFPGPDSWTIFELKGNGPEFLLSFCRKGDGLQAFFLSGTFEHDVFFDKDKSRTPSEILKFVKTHKWGHSELLSEKEEIRQILWGQHKDEQFQRFAWTSYRNYPLLIELLSHNSSEKGIRPFFINKFLLSAQPKSKQQLNLKNLRESISEFQNAWKDVRLAEEKSPDAQNWLQDFNAYTNIKQKKADLGAKALFQVEKLKEEKKLILNQQKENKKSLNLLQKKIQETEGDFSHGYKSKLKELGYWEHSLQIAREKQKERKAENTDGEEKDIPDETLLLKKNRWIQLEQAKYLLEYSDELSKLEESFQRKYLQNNEEIDEVLGQYQTLAEERTKLNDIRQKEARDEDEPVFSKDEASLRKAHLEEVLSLTESQRDQELKLAESGKENEKLILLHSIRPYENRIQQLNQWLENKSKSFYGWLDSRYPGWQKTIGKVVKEEVLFDAGLNPGLVRLNDLLYGIQINIGDLSYQVPTIEELNIERNELQSEIDKQKSDFQAFLEDHKKQVQNIEKKYRGKIRQLRKSIQEIDVNLQQSELRRKRDEAEQKQAFQIQQQERQKLALQLDYKKNDLETRLEELRYQLSDLPKSLWKEKQLLQEAYQKQLANLESLYEEQFPSDHSQGPNPDLEQQWLDEIHHISKIPHFQSQLAKVKREILEMEEAVEAEKSRQFQAFHEIERSILSHTEKLEQIDELVKKWEPFHEPFSPVENEKDLVELLAQIELSRSEEKRMLDKLVGEGIILQQHFSEENVFNIPLHSLKEESLGALQSAFSKLEEENLSAVKEQLAQKFSGLISLIADQSSKLKEVAPIIQDELDKLKPSLDSLSLPGILLELEIKESHNPLIRILKDIHSLYEQSGNQLGGVSLFNPEPDGEANMKAIELLSSLETILLDQPDKFLDLAEAVNLVLPSVDPPHRPWLNLSLSTALLSTIKERNEDLPLYIITDEVDKYGKTWTASLHKMLDRSDLRIVSSSQVGIGANHYGQILIWKDEGWIETKKN